jgi:hypothetical protein
MRNEAIYADVIAGLEADGVHVESNRKSVLLRVIAWILKPIDRGFLDHVTVTLGKNVYVPESQVGRVTSWYVLMHEWCHVEQHKSGFFFLRYLFPQCLAIFSILAIWNLYMLLFLLFLLPWPAPYRLNMELEGYLTMHAISEWGLKKGGHMDDIIINEVSDVLTSWRYYFASWSRGYVAKKLKEKMYKLSIGGYDNKKPFRNIRNILLSY